MQLVVEEILTVSVLLSSSKVLVHSGSRAAFYNSSSVSLPCSSTPSTRPPTRSTRPHHCPWLQSYAAIYCQEYFLLLYEFQVRVINVVMLSSVLVIGIVEDHFSK